MKYIISAIVVLVITGILKCIFSDSSPEDIFPIVGITTLVVVFLYGIIIHIDFSSKTNDTEIWSGKITKVEHEEEWDEWIPPRTETYTTKDSKGKVTTHTRVIPGYWQHHYATNIIKTSDGGTIHLTQTPDGRKLTDDFVNSTEELKQYYPLNSPTASFHTFTNKVQASYSIFKHEDIDLDDYPDLPSYPNEVTPNYTIDRLIGKFKNKEEMNKYLNEINTNLNDTYNPNNKDKVKSYKQVNLMLVNFGDKPKEYGYALQDYWENGAKNDFVVTFGTDNKGKPTWCYVFSWSDSELLKQEVRNCILSLDDINKDFKSTLTEISNQIEKGYKRKEFKDFEYIQIELSTISKVIMVLILGILVFVIIKEN